MRSHADPQINALASVMDDSPYSALVLEIPSGRIVAWNERARTATPDRPLNFDHLVDAPVQLELLERRWLRFVADREPYTAVVTICLDDIELLAHCSTWPLGSVRETAQYAMVVLENLRAEPWGGSAADWLERWRQPAAAVRTDGDVVHLNRVFLEALGYRTRADVPRERALLIEAAVRAVALRGDDGHATSITLNDRYDVAVEFVLGNASKLSVVDPTVTIVTGYDLTPCHDLPDTLTEREGQIARRIAIGLRVTSVAEELGLSEHTVRNHLRAIFAKVNVRSQADLVDALRSERR